MASPPLPVGPILAVEQPAWREAWASSSDPVWLLRLLAHLYPEKNETGVDAMVKALSFLPTAPALVDRLARSRPGMNMNGPDPFRYRFLANWLQQALATEDAALVLRAARSVRSVVADPFDAPSVPAG